MTDDDTTPATTATGRKKPRTTAPTLRRIIRERCKEMGFDDLQDLSVADFIEAALDYDEENA